MTRTDENLMMMENVMKHIESKLDQIGEVEVGTSDSLSIISLTLLDISRSLAIIADNTEVTR